MFFKETQYFCFMDYETTGVNTDLDTFDLPIQIGCIFTDHKLEKIEEYQAYINWSILSRMSEWPEQWVPSYKIHKIEVDKIKKEGLYVSQVVNDINTIIKDKIKPTDRKPVIISDAPNFEMFWTKYIWSKQVGKEFPFHYNAWSVYPVLQMMGIDTIQNKPHDALTDASMMLDAMRKAYEKGLEYERSNESSCSETGDLQ